MRWREWLTPTSCLPPGLPCDEDEDDDDDDDDEDEDDDEDDDDDCMPPGLLCCGQGCLTPGLRCCGKKSQLHEVIMS